MIASLLGSESPAITDRCYRCLHSQLDSMKVSWLAAERIMHPIQPELNKVFQDVFEDPSIAITEETSAKDIPTWDSLMHIQLIVSVEKTFGIRFAAGEIEKLQNVGDMMVLISRKKCQP